MAAADAGDSVDSAFEAAVAYVASLDGSGRDPTTNKDKLRLYGLVVVPVQLCLGQ